MQQSRKHSRTAASASQAILGEIPLVKLVRTAPAIRLPFVLRRLQDSRIESWVVRGRVPAVVPGLTFELSRGLKEMSADAENEADRLTVYL
jgi:hypothetical protein